MANLARRKRVWLIESPSVPVRGVIVGRFLFSPVVLYRDINGKCYKSCHVTDEIVDRESIPRPQWRTPKELKPK